jgi:ferrous iron transport protein B
MKTEVVAVVGPPNAGKTTVFNWLTNSKYKTVNYPGATVEYSIAALAPHYGGDITVMDTPGTYSLIPKSEDEEVTRKALFNHQQFGSIQKVIAVVDSTQLARHLTLVEQLLESGFSVVVALTMSDLIRKTGLQINIAELSRALGCPVIAIEGLLGGGIKELVGALKEIPRISGGSATLKTLEWSKEGQLALLQKCDLLAKKVSSQSNHSVRQSQHILLERTRRWDQLLLHPFLGLLVFILIMSALFTAIFAVAAPFMDAIDSFFSLTANKVSLLGNGQLWTDFLGNGIIVSFGAVLVFVPQIFILFLLIGYLESTGYLARAATLIDRPLSFFGMSGRSFVPLLSGFACAVPALMATRNISSKRDRFITMMIIPLMTCSARLPVYALLLAFLFKGRPPWQAGLGLTGLYFGAIVISAIVSQVLHKMLKPEKNAFFMMELPLYRQPRLGVVFHQAWTKTLGYIKRAGPPIFIFAMIIWVATTFPNFRAESDQVKLQTSYAGQVGQVIEPVFKPMGVDWRVGVGLLAAFSAREVFASSLAVVFNVTANVTADDDAGMQEGLLNSMSEARDSSGHRVFTFASVLGLLVFVMVALQCTATTAMMIRETQMMSWAIVQLIAYNLLAYCLAVGVYQIWS